MARVRFEEVEAGGGGVWDARFRKRRDPPPGYTANTYITEWLTLNCRGDWGSVADNYSVRVRFADPDDLARALKALPAMARSRS